MEQNNVELANAITEIKKYRFLEALKKEGCEKTATELAHFFYTLPSPGGTYKPPIIQLYALEAIDDLIINHSVKTKEEIRSLSKARRQKLEELRNALFNVHQLLRDPEIIDHYYTLAEKEQDVSPKTVLNALYDYCKRTSQMGINLDLKLYNKRKPGRPPLDELTSFIAFAARKFNNLSDQERFYVRKDQDDNGQYLWHATNSGLFIGEAIKWMYEYCETDSQIQYTNSQIYTACSNAQKIIQQEEIGE